MKVRELLKLLVDQDMDAEIQCINVNDARDEFSEDIDAAKADITSVGEVDEGTVFIYYIGEMPKNMEEDDLQ